MLTATKRLAEGRQSQAESEELAMELAMELALRHQAAHAHLGPGLLLASSFRWYSISASGSFAATRCSSDASSCTAAYIARRHVNHDVPERSPHTTLPHVNAARLLLPVSVRRPPIPMPPSTPIPTEALKHGALWKVFNDSHRDAVLAASRSPSLITTASFEPSCDGSSGVGIVAAASCHTIEESERTVRGGRRSA